MNDIRTTNPEVRILCSGLRSGSTNFSTCRQDRNETTTAIPMFWGFQLSDGIGCDADRPNRRLEIQDGSLQTPNILPVRAATEHICLTVEIVLPSCLRTEICVFPVWRPQVHLGITCSDFSVQHSYDCHWIAGYQKHRLEFR